MKSFPSPLGLPLVLVVLLLLTGRSQAQTSALVIDQARVLPWLATPGQGRLVELRECTDAQGNTYQAGTFDGTVHFGPFTFTTTVPVGMVSDYDVIVAKRNAAGVYQWAVAAGGAGEQRCKSVALDPAGNVVLAGTFTSVNAQFGGQTLTNAATRGTSDVFVAKLDGAGSWQWAASAGGGTNINGDDYATTVTADVLGNVYVAGTFTSSVALFGPSVRLVSPDNAGREAVYVAKLDPAGTWQWARRSEVCCGAVASVVTDANTDVYLGTQFNGIAQYGILTVTAGGYQAGGTAVVKLDGNGAWQWIAVAQSSRRTTVSCGGLKIGQRGDLYVSGRFVGDTATFGATRLFNQGPMPQPVNGAAPYYHTENAYLARLDATRGTWRWAVQTQGDGYESISSPVVDSVGNVYVGAAYFPPTFMYWPQTPGYQLGATTILPQGGNDLVIAKVDTSGNWMWIRQAGSTDDESAAPVYIVGGRVYLSGSFDGPSLTIGTVTLTAPTLGARTGFITRLAPDSPLSVGSNHSPTDFAVYPNPARHTITVSGGEPGQAVQVLDVLGRQVATGRIPTRGPLRLDLPLGLLPGVYVVRAGTRTRWLVVE